eukprot:TRINITY_DN19877_c0_g1_i1.p1 TRINITY_DN19877_c0_g1~~TRINITY_DN19877_c0_g1_i1.p1  ORF type:complete len:282 (+),score=48.26 TRINITY_DN19877_c0_g1_i1:55-900(+)
MIGFVNPAAWLAVFLIVAVVFMSVFLIISCLDCGKKQEYEKLDNRVLENKDREYQEKKQTILQRSEAWYDAQYYVRSFPKCKLLDQVDLWEMGCRKEKTHFLIKYEGDSCLFTMVPPGDECVFPLRTESGRLNFRKVLTLIEHPFIHKTRVTDFWLDQGKAVIFSNYSEEGSLRDVLYKSKPTQKFAQKYKNFETKSATTLSKGKTALYGRQILEALIYLKECGIPYTHLHTGNVIIKNDVARITNVENGLLNLERQNERLLRQFSKKSPKFSKMDLNDMF